VRGSQGNEFVVSGRIRCRGHEWSCVRSMIVLSKVAVQLFIADYNECIEIRSYAPSLPSSCILTRIYSSFKVSTFGVGPRRVLRVRYHFYDEKCRFALPRLILRLLSFVKLFAKLSEASADYSVYLSWTPLKTFPR